MVYAPLTDRAALMSRKRSTTLPATVTPTGGRLLQGHTRQIS